MNIQLISLDQAKISLEVQIEILKINELNNIFIGQNLWNNDQIVGKITKINQDSNQNLIQHKKPEKELENRNKNRSLDLDKNLDLVAKAEDSKIESEFKILSIECLGNFENCKWKGGWKFANNFILSPKMWEKDDNFEDLENEFKINPTNPQPNLEKEKEIKILGKTLENIVLTNKNYRESQNNQAKLSKMTKSEITKPNENQKYYFIPTVQKFETVVAGQKLGFVETNGHLYWLICPNFEAQYQVQIESGEFEISSTVGILVSKNREYKLTLEQNLNFNFGLIGIKSNEIISCGIPLFDLFCPFVMGSKTILHNFGDSEIKTLLTNFDQNYQAKLIIITDFCLFIPQLNIFKSTNWLELTKYFALCGNNVIIILENLPLNFGEYLDFFGNFETIDGEICSVSFFWILSEQNDKNKDQQSQTASQTAIINSKYFENYWKLNEKDHKIETNSQKILKNLENHTSYPKNANLSYKNTQIITLPDIANSFGLSNFKNLLTDNIHKQNSPFINQNSNKNSLNNLNLELIDLTNPFYKLVMRQNTQNIEQSLTLWELFSWTKNKFGEKSEQSLAHYNQNSKINSNPIHQLPNSLTEKIQQNSQKIIQLIQKNLQNGQNGQNLIEIKSEISKILE